MIEETLEKKSGVLENVEEDGSVIIDGQKYIPCMKFAELAKCTRQNISLLCLKGNSRRKMKHIKIGPSLLVLEEELRKYPFKADRLGTEF